MIKQAKVEIIAIGNELLLGDVLDTNTHWLCKRITGAGGQVARAAMIKDDTAAIADEIRSALDRLPDLIITTGGLGPTGDDITLRAVAEALARPLELHAEALTLVKARYKNLAEGGGTSRTLPLPMPERRWLICRRVPPPSPTPSGGQHPLLCSRSASPRWSPCPASR